MALIAEFTLPLEAFPMGNALRSDPALQIEFERIVPSEENVVPFFWARESDDFDRLEACARGADEIVSLELIDEVANGRLYRAVWDLSKDGLMKGLSHSNATALRISGSKRGWWFELRFAAHEDIGALQTYCARNGVPIRLCRLYTLTEMMDEGRYDLTKTQRDTLLAAYQSGYFEDPQGITQAELAERFGVSQRAVSKRLRSGVSRLIGTTLASEA